MRILVVGSGGVGDAVARIAARRDFFELMVVADVALARAEHMVEAARAGEAAHTGASVAGRFVAATVDDIARSATFAPGEPAGSPAEPAGNSLGS